MNFLIPILIDDLRLKETQGRERIRDVQKALMATLSLLLNSLQAEEAGIA